MIPVKEYSSAAEIIEAARRARMAIMNGRAIQSQVTSEADAIEPIQPAKIEHAPQCADERADAKPDTASPMARAVLDRLAVEKAMIEMRIDEITKSIRGDSDAPRPFMVAMMALCMEHGISRATLIGPRRDKEIVEARHAITRRLAKEFPHLALTTLGRLLNRDHSSILYALGRTGKAKASLDQRPENTSERN